MNLHRLHRFHFIAFVVLEAQQRYLSYREDSCSDSITKLFGAGVSRNYRAPRGALQNGVSHRCACVKLSTKRGVSHNGGGAANLPEKVSRDMGYRSDSIAISRGMGPLSSSSQNPLQATPLSGYPNNPILVGQRFAHQRFADSRESNRKKKHLFLKHCPGSRESRLPSDSHSNFRDLRPILAAIPFLEGRFAKRSFRSGNRFARMILGEAKPGGFQTRMFPTFFGKGPDCVADPFGTVPRRCSKT